MEFRDVVYCMMREMVANYTSQSRVSADKENSNANAQVLELTGGRSKHQVPLYPISRSLECLRLHGPMEKSPFPLKYNIILHVPDTDKMFSLYRTDNKDEAETQFKQFKECLTPLLKIDQRICDLSQLQRMSVVIRRNPGWAAVHLIAYFDLHQYYRHDTLVTHINDLGGSLSKTPLHIAVERGNRNTVNTLLDLNAEMDRTDGKLNTVINKAVVYPSRSIVLLKDSNDGGTPLHWAQTAEIISLLLERGCDPNIVDNHGRSALHNAVRRGDLKSTLMLLCHQCHPDSKDKEGDTPLHVAARLCSRHIIQALIVFRADIDITNKRGHTARHLVCTSGRDDAEQVLYYLDKVGAKRCLATPSDSTTPNECVSGCSATGTVHGSAPVNCVLHSEVQLMDEALNAFSIQEGMQKRECQSQNSGESFQRSNSRLDQTVGGRLLTLDGGGIRGLVLIQMLLVIEEVVGLPIKQLFDWISGTSTGGILGLGLAVGKTVLQMQGLYIRLKDTIFAGTKPYSAELMESFLKKEFGEDLKMGDIRRPRVLITTTVVDTRPVEFHFFRNYLSPESIMNGNSQVDPGLEEYVWRVAKWTGAAPLYFKLDGSKYADGGLIANNPTLDALTELIQLGVAMKSRDRCGRVDIPNVVLSLGCGVQPKERVNPENFNFYWPRTMAETLSAVNKLLVMLNLLADQATQSDGQVVERSRAWCSSIGVPFYRFSPPCPKFIDLDETSDDVLVDLMWTTRAYMLERRDKVQELGRVLRRKAPSVVFDMET